MIKKLYLNYSFNISQKSLDIIFCVLLAVTGDVFTLSFFPMAHLLLIQQGYGLTRDFYKEI